MPSLSHADELLVFEGKAFSADSFSSMVPYCGAPVPTEAEAKSINASLKQFEKSQQFKSLKGTEKIHIPVHFHVIRDARGNGDVEDRRIKSQIKKLNQELNRHGIEFTLESINRYQNDNWFHASPMDQQGLSYLNQMKRQLVTDPTKSLNIYTVQFARQPGGMLLGYAAFPWELQSNLQLDGIVLNHVVVPGKYSQYTGDTAIHELGHWLGLWHVFYPRGQCGAPGDSVTDTPAQYSVNPGSCSAVRGKDTCPGEGPDAYQNYMNYSPDDCMDEFSRGQIARIRGMVAQYRPQLIVRAPAPEPPPETDTPTLSDDDYQDELIDIMRRP